MQRDVAIGVGVAAVLALLLAGVGYWMTLDGPEPDAGEPVAAKDTPDEAKKVKKLSPLQKRAPAGIKPLQPMDLKIQREWKPGMAKLEPDAGDVGGTPPEVEQPTVDEEGRYVARPKGIRAAMEEIHPKLTECYESWLEVEPELEGTIKVGFKIVPQDGVGVVRDVTTREQTVDHEVFEGCVLNVMNELEFEAPDGGAMTVNWPVVFTQSDEG